MHRSMRVGLFALLLVGVVGGSALAAAPHTGKTPSVADSSKPEAPASPAELSHAVDRLGAQGITTTTGDLGALADKYGLGGAVRLMAWAKKTGKTVAELSAMRDAGKGWGQIAKDLGVSPGIGWIMGNGHAGGHAGGSGKDTAPGLQTDEAPSLPGLEKARGT